MSDLQDDLQGAIDRFTLALPLLDNPGEGAAQYRDDAQAIADAARRVVNLDIDAAHQARLDGETTAEVVDVALGIAEDE